MGLVICAASLLARGNGREAFELRKKAWHMPIKLELDSIDSVPKYKFPPPRFPHGIEKEINNRLRLGIFALDTLITLYLGEPIASHLSMLPMGRLRDDVEENQDCFLSMDPTIPIRYEDSRFPAIPPQPPQPAFTISTHMAQVNLYKMFAKIVHPFYLDKSKVTNSQAQEL